MPLILAIEPDRRQAARVAAVAKGTLDAELVVADSTEHGVAALNGRVPDLILTSLLLSPKDEAGLRDFHRAGVVVPTLMIPVLASSSRQRGKSGGLFKRLRSKSAADPGDADGCDPSVFAAQISEYLEAARTANDEYQEGRGAQRVPEVQADREVLAAREAHAVYEETAAPDAFTEPAGAPVGVEPMARPEPVALAEQMLAVDAVDADEVAPDHGVASTPDTPVAERLEPFEQPEDVDQPQDVERPARVLELHMLPRMPVASAPVDEHVDVAAAATTDIGVDREIAIGDFDEFVVVEEEPEPDDAATLDAANASNEWNDGDDTWEEIVLDDPRTSEDEGFPDLVLDSFELDGFVQELEARYSDAPRLTVQAPHLQPAALDLSVRTRESLAHALPARPTWPRMEGPAADTPPAEMADLVADFVAALEHGEDEPGDPQHADPDSDLWMPLSTSPGACWPRLDSPVSKRKDVQDEWGFFDPEQCGFRALVARLDEMSR